MKMVGWIKNIKGKCLLQDIALPDWEIFKPENVLGTHMEMGRYHMYYAVTY